MIFDVEAPEYDEARAYMTPREALTAALRSEEKAWRFFSQALPRVKDGEVKKLFQELQDEELEHQAARQEGAREAAAGRGLPARGLRRRACRPRLTPIPLGCAPSFMRRPLLAAATSLALLTAASAAHAYRPFDGTDADVAGLGDFELELGPVHWYSQGDSHYLLAPATVLNLGFMPRWELVIDFQNSVGIDPPPGEARDRLLDTDVLVKTVLLQGSLQDKGAGPERRRRVRAAGAERQRRRGLRRLARCHHVAALELDDHPPEQLARAVTRRSAAQLFEGAIIEGDTEAAVRPVSEWYVAYDFGAHQTTVSGLVGGIWKAGDSLDLDVGLREASVGGERATEVRLGLTWTLGVWTPAEEKAAHRGHRWLAMAR